MPAVTADTLTLPRLPGMPQAETRWRPVDRVVTAQRTVEGEGFAVRRPFPHPEVSLADPFLLLDHLGAVHYAPGEAKGAPWHPHRGFETVTYIMDGKFEHRDSTGGGGLLTDGATQWMTAGGGILHSELPPQDFVAKGGLFHGVQLWVNLPAALKWTPPRYQEIGARSVKLLSSDDGGALLRVIAGELAGHEGPGVTWTPITYLHATVQPGARLSMPWSPGFNAMVYALAGDGLVGVERRPLREGQLALFGEGDALTIEALGKQPDEGFAGWEVLVLGGEPINEPVARYGPFVMNTRAEIVQALSDHRAGTLGQTQVGELAHRTGADEEV